ncbi:MAG: enoyl-CoA hydratase/isomerase family protein [Pseudonocardia sp.]
MTLSPDTPAGPDEQAGASSGTGPKVDDAEPEQWLPTERRDGTLVITINRPHRLNALAWDLIADLGTILADAAADDEVRAVVLTGAGRAFSAGGDVKDQKRRARWGVVERLDKITPVMDTVRACWEFPKPLIAAVNGVAAGAGAGLALVCDVRYASTEARFGFPFVKVGLGPDYGVSYTLPRLVGPGQAARLMYSARYVDAAEALRIGLVEEVFPADELLDGAVGLAAEIAAVAPLGVRLSKQALRRSASIDFATAITTEIAAQFLATQTEDHLEGATAFAEKRPPVFRNR